MEPTLTETAQLAVTTTMEESPGPGQLPDDVFNQVLEYLDGDALLASCRVDRSWAKNTEGCSAAWRGAAGAEDADDWNSGRYLVWRARTKEIVVVELGATGDRVGIAWARAPARVPVPTAVAADRAKRFEHLKSETPAARRPREDAATVVQRVAAAVAAVGLGSIEGLSLCVVSPHLASETSRTRLLNALLSAGAKRARVEDATLCAVAASGVRPPCVVLDVGATESVAVPVDRDGCVPDAVREGAHNIQAHLHTRLRHVGFDGVAAALARTAGIEDLKEAEEAVCALAYCRHVSPAMVAPSAEELEFCATADGLSSARFECVEALFAEPTGIVRLVRAAAAARAANASTIVPTIVLAGGGTDARGFGRRIRRELSGGKIVPADNEARRDLIWHGATRLARNFTYYPKLMLRRRRPSGALAHGFEDSPRSRTLRSRPFSSLLLRSQV